MSTTKKQGICMTKQKQRIDLEPQPQSVALLDDDPLQSEPPTAANVAWPAESPFAIEWLHSGEIDPQPGDILGWNWNRREIAIVTAAPETIETWPYTLTVEIRPMPEAWRRVEIFNLETGERLNVAWYTRWNRAYEEREKGGKGEGERQPDSTISPAAATGSGWLAVIQARRYLATTAKK